MRKGFQLQLCLWFVLLKGFQLLYDVLIDAPRYVPAGMVVAEAQSEDTDGIGLKLHIIAEQDTDGREALQEMQKESRAIGKQSPAMDDLLSLLEQRQKEQEQAEPHSEMLLIGFGLGVWRLGEVACKVL